MRILLASNSLTGLGGSETYLLTLGRELQRLGHEIHVLEGPGGAGTIVAEAGLLQVPSAGALPGRPDRAIVQDGVVAGEVAAAWPDVPQVFVIHSTIHDLQLTADVPSSVAAYVALNDLTASRARALAGDRPVVRLTQPIDLERFWLGPPPEAVPRRLLLFGNNAPQGRHQALVEECARRGIEVVRLGHAAGRTTSDPSDELRAADIVVGYGRCILEAMACGRTAFVFDRFGSDGWVDAGTYEALESMGFNGLVGLDEPGRVDFGAVLDAYDPGRGWAGLDLARRHHNAKRHAVAVVEVLEGLGPIQPAEPQHAFALGRVWREQWRWEVRSVGLAQQVSDLATELGASHQREAELRERLHGAEERAAAAEADAAAAHEGLDASRRDAQQLAADRDDAERRLDAVLRSRRYRLGARIGALVDVVLRRRTDEAPAPEG